MGQPANVLSMQQETRITLDFIRALLTGMANAGTPFPSDKELVKAELRAQQNSLEAVHPGDQSTQLPIELDHVIHCIHIMRETACRFFDFQSQQLLQLMQQTGQPSPGPA